MAKINNWQRLITYINEMSDDEKVSVLDFNIKFESWSSVLDGYFCVLKKAEYLVKDDEYSYYKKNIKKHIPADISSSVLRKYVFSEQYKRKVKLERIKQKIKNNKDI